MTVTMTVPRKVTRTIAIIMMQVVRSDGGDGEGGGVPFPMAPLKQRRRGRVARRGRRYSSEATMDACSHTARYQPSRAMTGVRSCGCKNDGGHTVRGAAVGAGRRGRPSVYGVGYGCSRRVGRCCSRHVRRPTSRERTGI